MNERTDDFETRREHLRDLSDEALRDYFWQLVDRIVEPLVEEARTHTSPSIERAVLLRMGFSSLETKSLVNIIQEQGLLGRGAGRLILELARKKGISIHQVGRGLIQGRYLEELGK